MRHPRRSAPLPTSLFLSHNEALVPPYRVIVDTNFINLSLENRIDVVKGMSALRACLRRETLEADDRFLPSFLTPVDSLYAKCEAHLASRGELRCARRPAVGRGGVGKIEPRQLTVDPAPGIPCISDCVIAELEKLGQKYRLALRCVPSLALSLSHPPGRLTPPPFSNSVARDPRFERLPCSHKGTYADDCIVERVNSHRCYIVATCDRALRRRLRKVPGVPVRRLLHSFERPVS